MKKLRSSIDVNLVLMLMVNIAYYGLCTASNQKSNLELSTKSRVTGVEGSNFFVKCTANVPEPPISLQWVSRRKDQDTTIQQSRVSNFSVELRIVKLDRSDAGVYKCVMIGADKEEEEKEVVLYVEAKDPKSVCGITRFRCREIDQCIFQRYICDGVSDCPDGTDEEESLCTSTPCKGKYLCNNSRCVDPKLVCDKVDSCGDNSDEIEGCLQKDVFTYVSTPGIMMEEGEHFNWLKTTVYTVIGCTVAVVILISFIVIVVFRLKMKRLRARRLARYIEQQHRQGGSNSFDTGPSDQDPFLAFSTQSHYGNIIVNVNNGVQCVRPMDLATAATGFHRDLPPPYSEVVKPTIEPPPPPYSTLDRQGVQKQGEGSMPSNAAGFSGHGSMSPARQESITQSAAGSEAPLSGGHGSALVSVSVLSTGSGLAVLPVTRGVDVPSGPGAKRHTSSADSSGQGPSSAQASRQQRLSRSSRCDSISEGIAAASGDDDAFAGLQGTSSSRSDGLGEEPRTSHRSDYNESHLPLALPPRSTSLGNSMAGQANLDPVLQAASPGNSSITSSNLIVQDGRIVLTTGSGIVHASPNMVAPSCSMARSPSADGLGMPGKLEVHQGQIILSTPHSVVASETGQCLHSGTGGCELEVRDGKIVFRR